ncbi:trimeric intracellular cation channel family protein [Halostagnicola kamekurae]|nr:TRIC cation channel family protein [Halostagnicola kamekurae]
MGGLLEQLLGDPFTVMNAVGLIAFALVGATKAIRERFDIFGVTVVGLATAFAGGATRDILVDRVPLALRSLGEVSLGVFGVALAIGLSMALESPDDHPFTVVADAVGLAAFTTAGAIVAADSGLPGFGVVVIATINAVGGGAIADILLDRTPFIMIDDFYASCAVLGGTTYWLLDTAGIGGGAAALCATVTVGTRLAAVYCQWALPTPHNGNEQFE